jgi:hypothetical protein
MLGGGAVFAINSWTQPNKPSAVALVQAPTPVTPPVTPPVVVPPALPVTPPVIPDIPPVNIPPVNIPPVNIPPVNIPPVNIPPVNIPPVNIPPVNIPPVTPTPTPTFPLSFSQLNTALTSNSGLTVTVASIVKNQTAGYKEYTISYTLKNNTTDKSIDEGTFKMFYVGGESEPQYGFFDKLLPTDSRTRTYTWKALNTQEPLCIEFESDFFAKGPDANTFKWQVPP